MFTVYYDLYRDAAVVEYTVGTYHIVVPLDRFASWEDHVLILKEKMRIFRLLYLEWKNQ